ncbi:hypothetical protein [Veillonella agrestimuris]|uniref:hypothetical protein n=1 Tax=Veillonella agrestimuris TaxID=2941340 RepID=UPI00203AB337|nr:hypothetical protein [Veillonella agrestimuris]
MKANTILLKTILLGLLATTLSLPVVATDTNNKEPLIIHAVSTIGGNPADTTYYNSEAEAQKALEKKLEEQNKLTIKNREKRGPQTKAQIISSLKRINPHPPVEKTAALQSELYSSFLGTPLDLHMTEVYVADYDTIKSGEPYVYAEYVDMNNANVFAEQDTVTAISAPIITSTFRKDENKSFGIEGYIYFIDSKTKSVSMAYITDLASLSETELKNLSNNKNIIFKVPNHTLTTTDDNYKMALLLYKKLTNKTL